MAQINSLICDPVTFVLLYRMDNLIWLSSISLLVHGISLASCILILLSLLFWLQMENVCIILARENGFSSERSLWTTPHILKPLCDFPDQLHTHSILCDPHNTDIIYMGGNASGETHLGTLLRTILETQCCEPWGLHVRPGKKGRLWKFKLLMNRFQN